MTGYSISGRSAGSGRSQLQESRGPPHCGRLRIGSPNRFKPAVSSVRSRRGRSQNGRLQTPRAACLHDHWFIGPPPILIACRNEQDTTNTKENSSLPWRVFELTLPRSGRCGPSRDTQRPSAAARKPGGRTPQAERRRSKVAGRRPWACGGPPRRQRPREARKHYPLHPAPDGPDQAAEARRPRPSASTIANPPNDKRPSRFREGRSLPKWS